MRNFWRYRWFTRDLEPRDQVCEGPIVDSSPNDQIRIPCTRQQIADMSGSRVETVIRTVKKLEKQGKLVLQGHKIVF